MVPIPVLRFLILLEYLALFVLIILGVLAWEVSRGPVPLTFLTPYVADFLEQHVPDLDMDMDSAELYWGGWGQEMGIRAQGVVLREMDNGLVAEVPDLYFQINPHSLMEGRIQVQSLTLERPVLRVRRDADGGFPAWQAASTAAGELRNVPPTPEPEPASAKPPAPDPLGAMGPPRPRRRPLPPDVSALVPNPATAAVVRDVVSGLRGSRAALAQGKALARVLINNGRVVVDDQRLETTWQLSEVFLSVDRGRDAVAMDLSFGLETGGAPSSIALHARLPREGTTATAALQLADIWPVALGRFLETVPFLDQGRLPLNGTVHATFDLGPLPTVNRMGFDIRGGAGTVRLPPPLSQSYDVAGLYLSGHYSATDRRAVLEDLFLDLGGPALTANGTLALRPKTVGVHGVATVTGMTVAHLGDYWPQGVLPNPRRWVGRNLTAGTVSEARFTLAADFSRATEHLAIGDFDGRVRVRDATVHFLRPLPPVQGVDATVRLGPRRLDVTASGGRLRGLTVPRATVALTHLHRPREERLQADVTVTGPVRDALHVINQPPLRLLQGVSLPLARVQGSAETRLKVTVPLAAPVRFAQVDLDVASTLRGVVLPGMALGQDVRNGHFRLTANRQRVALTGRATVVGAPARVRWGLRLDQGRPRGRTHATLTLTPAQRRRLLPEVAALTAPFVPGPVGVTLDLSPRGAGQQVRVALDLTPTPLTLPPVGWSKRAGRPGRATLVLPLDAQGRLGGRSTFTVEAPRLEGQGHWDMAGGGRLETVTVKRLRVGRTNVGGTVRPRAGGGWEVALRGHALDLEPLLNRPDRDGRPLPLVISVALDRLFVRRGAALNAVRGTLRVWDGPRRADLKARLPSGAGMTLRLRTRADASQDWRIAVGNGGELLRHLGVYDDLVGGHLTVTAHQTGQRMRGRLELRNFRLMKAPIVARVLEVASLSGLVDALEGGRGLKMTALEVPFVKDGSMVHLGESRAYNFALGATAQGSVDLRSHALNLWGTLVPLYALNNLPGRLPLVGDLLAGSRDSGVLAMRYTVRGRPPGVRVGVNPLSLLTPGVLRRFFDLFPTAGRRP